MGLIWKRAMEWLSNLVEQEGVEGMMTGGGGKLGVGADKKAGASV